MKNEGGNTFAYSETTNLSFLDTNRQISKPKVLDNRIRPLMLFVFLRHYMPTRVQIEDMGS